MEQVQRQSAGKAVWRAYRQAFGDFSQKVQRVQDLASHPTPDRLALDAASLEVEEARAAYRDRRDAVAAHLLRCEPDSEDIICRTTAA